MKGQNIENNVNKKNSVGCVKLIRKQEIIVLCFSARQNVPQKPRKLNKQNHKVIKLLTSEDN